MLQRVSPRIIAELEDIVGREYALSSSEDLVCFSYDGTWVQHRPEVVVLPESTAQVSAVLRLANRQRIAVVPRGAGSGLAGGSVPIEGGIALSLTRMNKILEIDAANMVVVAQAGVVTADLHAAVEARGLFYPPDPASQRQSTIGGNVATCAGGPRGLKYGVTKDYVLGLEVVLPTGEIIRTGGKAIKNVTGYNLTQLFTGSEGTLGVITEATLRLIPRPRARGTIMAAFPRLADASEAVAQVLQKGVMPATIEMMDNTTIRCVEAYLHLGLPTQREAMLLIDVDGEPEVIPRATAEVAQACADGGAVEVRIATTERESQELWAARQAVSSSLGRARPDRVGEDIAVPRSAIPAMVARIQDIAQRHRLTIAIFGHISDGNLHPNILFDRRDPEEVARVHRAAREIATTAVQLGGTLSGEHGIGLLKRDFLSADLSPEVIALMRKIKVVFDPNGIMNPGKVFPPTDNS